MAFGSKMGISQAFSLFACDWGDMERGMHQFSEARERSWRWEGDWACFGVMVVSVGWWREERRTKGKSWEEGMRRTLAGQEELTWVRGPSIQQHENSNKKTDCGSLVQKCHACLLFLMGKKAMSLNGIWLPNVSNIKHVEWTDVHMNPILFVLCRRNSVILFFTDHNSPSCSSLHQRTKPLNYLVKSDVHNASVSLSLSLQRHYALNPEVWFPPSIYICSCSICFNSLKPFRLIYILALNYAHCQITFINL